MCSLAVSTAAGKPSGLALPDLVKQINDHHHQCEAALQAGLQHALEAGRLLLEAKGRVGHGEWLPWLEEHFEGSTRTAQTYLRVAREYPRLDGKAQRVAHLTLRGAVRAIANNCGAITRMPETKQDAALEAWETCNCKNACQAGYAAERLERERRAAARAHAVNDVDEDDPGDVDEAKSQTVPFDRSAKSDRGGPAEELPEDTIRGVGTLRAREAVDCLKRIPKNDRLRKRGFQIVSDWIRSQAGEAGFQDILDELRELRADVKALKSRPEGVFVPQTMIGLLRAASKELKEVIPSHTCPKCQSKGCPICRLTGRLPAAVAVNLGDGDGTA